jgi:hypothetical protein
MLNLWNAYVDSAQVAAHVVTRLATSPVVLSGLLDTAKLMGALCALCALCMVHPRTRRATIAVTRFAQRYAPAWLVPVLTVCAFIPGPIDELAVIAAVLFPVLRNSRNRRVFARYVRSAWKG